MHVPKEKQQRIIFDKYPGLRDIQWIPLMDNVPTPVELLENFSSRFSGYQVWIKRDDICSSIYGGNKPRKFEFLFGDAIAKNKTTIVTAGGTATNHGLAAAIYSKKLGIKCKLYLFDQPLTFAVQKKLLMYISLGAELKYIENYAGLIFHGLIEYLFHRRNYLMLPGGSPAFKMGSARGCLGFVNAALELARQVGDGTLPEPDYVFIPAGSTGTAAGLILGLKLAGLKTKVMPVQVSEPLVTNPSAIISNIKKTNRLMQKYDNTVPTVTIKHPDDFHLLTGYLGSKYGAVTRRGLDAIDLVEGLEYDKNFHLETTYTGKTCAAMIDFMKENPNTDEDSKICLFWNTYNSIDKTQLAITTNFDYSKLPREFHKYFKTKLTCWQIKNCTNDDVKDCLAYYNDDNRCWKVKETLGMDTSNCEKCKIRNKIEDLLNVEDS
ncbi:MAG: 1-aminocyclopropane-1-carboxylate deaminase/D-cysteine desulfhydrase [Promethearchaeota archaeon]